MQYGLATFAHLIVERGLVIPLGKHLRGTVLYSTVIINNLEVAERVRILYILQRSQPIL